MGRRLLEVALAHRDRGEPEAGVPAAPIGAQRAPVGLASGHRVAALKGRVAVAQPFGDATRRRLARNPDARQPPTAGAG